MNGGRFLQNQYKPSRYNNHEKNGQAYYFTPYGCREHDDKPKYIVTKHTQTEEESNAFRNDFNDANKNGITYLFAWFDPLYYHCYGFHFIKTSEGR